MIYFFHGSDIEKVRTKAFEWIAKARVKEPNLVYARLAREELTDSSLEEVAQSGGLFVKRLLVLIDDPFQNVKDIVSPSSDDGLPVSINSEDIIEKHLDALATSDNAIIILAPKLLATKAKKISEKAKLTYEFNKTIAREDARGFNNNLVNALASRSREKLWIEINRALMSGDAPEMLHGLLHWKARDIMEKGSRNWTSQESRKLSLTLIELLQSSRRGGLDLSLSLERFALSI